jgi:Xaa-Pro aminopeptidase
MPSYFNFFCSWPFRQHNDFLYLTGFQEPDSVLLLSKTNNRSHFHLLVRPRDAHKELWDGPRAGVEGAMKHFGPDAADELDELPRVLSKLLAGGAVLYVPKEPPPPSFPHTPLSVMQEIASESDTKICSLPC